MPGPRGPEYAVVTWPDEVELCGVCGQRIERLPPEGRDPCCFRCGRAEEAPSVRYVRADVRVPDDLATFVYWVVKGDTRRSFGEALRGIKKQARALMKKYRIGQKP